MADDLDALNVFNGSHSTISVIARVVLICLFFLKYNYHLDVVLLRFRIICRWLESPRSNNSANLMAANRLMRPT